MRFLRPLIAVGLALFALLVPSASSGCPLLLCVEFDIGDARSLPPPANDQSASTLVRDMLAVLDSGPTALVATETVRRAFGQAIGDKPEEGIAEVRRALRRRLQAPQPSAKDAARNHFLAGFFEALARLGSSPSADNDAAKLVERAVALDGAEPIYSLGLALVLWPRGEWKAPLKVAADATKDDPRLRRTVEFVVTWIQGERDPVSGKRNTGLAKELGVVLSK